MTSIESPLLSITGEFYQRYKHAWSTKRFWTAYFLPALTWWFQYVIGQIVFKTKWTYLKSQKVCV